MFQIAVQGCMGPVLWVFAQTSMHRTEIDQIAVTGLILRVANHMFPITPLPDGFFAPIDLGRRAVGGHRAGT